MSEIQNERSESSLVYAIEANLFEFFSLYTSWSQAEVHDDADMLWTMTNIPFPIFNNVLRAQLAGDELDAAIETVITRGKVRNVPLLWWTGPATKPHNLGVSLVEHGFVYDGEGPGMAVDLQFLQEDIPAPAGFRIEQVKDDKTLNQWSHVLPNGFGLPEVMADAIFALCQSIGFAAQTPLRNYIGWLDEQPVATSSLCLGAGVAGIYNVTTLPEVRRQGIGARMTLFPLCEARRMGYKIGILHASPMGVNVYRRLGFQEYCKIGQYVWTGEPAHSQ
ncbi:MAG: GNAT family N-acetyltransferase [Caldilineaceae bacterium]